MYGKYLYGVIAGGGDTILGVGGLVGTSLIHSVVHNGLSCVVSDYNGSKFGTMPREERGRYLVTHQTVVEQVAKRHPVLPFKFGTVLATSEKVHKLLGQGQPQFSLTLLWIQDKFEVQVLAKWAGERVMEDNKAGLEILPAEGSITRKQLAASEVYYPQDYLEKIVDFLQPVSVDVQYYPPRSGEMTMNVAFLVAKANLDAFRGRVEQLNSLFSSVVKFQVSGPLPPYSFALVEVISPTPEAINEAKQLLNLDEINGEVEVRQAYRRLTAEVEANRKLKGKLAKARIMALRRALELLVAYCRGQTENDGGFLISIRRSHSDEVHTPQLAQIES